MASFGALHGVASCVIQLGMALGPDFYGLLHDAFGGYRIPCWRRQSISWQRR
jgi:hypothetical protein